MIYYRQMISYRLKHLVAFYLLPFAICVLLFSCKDEQDTLDIDYKYGYFRLDSGHYVTYDVDSIFSYNSSFTKDTAHYQLMEVVTDTFYDNLNQLNYELTLYRREDAGLPWVFDRKWFVIKTQYNVQKIEDNLRFIKLVFQPEQNKAWNGNLYVSTAEPFRDYQNWDYHYESVDVPYSINGFSLDSTLSVSEVNDSSFVNKRLRKEIYAKNAGMIYQEFEIKTKQTVTSWDTGDWNGFSIRMRMIDHN